LPPARPALARAMAPPAAVAAAQWLKETMHYGLVCSVVESHKSIGRTGEFEDACTKTFLKLNRAQLIIRLPCEMTIQLKELKAVEGHSKRPSSPVFRTAKSTLFSRLVTLRWDQTGRATTAARYVHLVFPTRSDATAFKRVMGDVQRFGIASVLAGRSAQESVAEPTEWQIERAREHFATTIRGRPLRARLLRIIFPCVEDGQAEALSLANDEHSSRPEAVHEAIAVGPSLDESEEMHIRWADVLAGRSPHELSADELRPLIDAGMPLRYRHALWSKWVGERYLKSVEELHTQSLPDVSRQIELDIPRTHPTWMQDEQKAVLRRVLNAYSVCNPDVGYCQGMNFLAMVFLLLGFSESMILAGLVYIIEDVLPGCHARGLEGYLRDAAVLDALVHHRLPAVHLQLEALDVQMLVLGVDHFVSLMAGKWPLASVVRLWDFVLSEGSRGVFASFLALIELYFPMPGSMSGITFQGVDDAADAVDAFRVACMTGATLEMDKIVAASRRWLTVLPQSLIDKLREDILAEDESLSPSAERSGTAL